MQLVFVGKRVAAIARAGKADEGRAGIAEKRGGDVLGCKVDEALARLGLPVGAEEGETIAVVDGFFEFLRGN